MTGRVSDAGLPLDGVRVLDFSRLLPGPWATQMLVDMGADVIKVEHVEGGDPSRHNPPMSGDTSVYFRSVNGGKRSLALDLRAEPSKAVIRRLFGLSDIVFESFSVGTADRLGVGYRDARAVRPDVIYCSISGYGQDGPRSSVPGHDLIIQATSGILSPQPGSLPHFQAGDYSAASMATIAVLAALRQRDASGEGRHLDISMADSLVAMGAIALGPGLARAAGFPGEPRIEVWGANPRYAIYPTVDGRTVAVCLLEARLWRAFCKAIGRLDLASEDERPEQRHSSHGARGEEFRSAIASWCAARTAAEIDAVMRPLGLPVAAVATADEAVSDLHNRQRGIIAQGDAGSAPILANPLARAGLARPERSAAPALGEHNHAILAELGLNNERGHIAPSQGEDARTES